jgi:hypothetical protein
MDLRGETTEGYTDKTLESLLLGKTSAKRIGEATMSRPTDPAKYCRCLLGRWRQNSWSRGLVVHRGRRVICRQERTDVCLDRSVKLRSRDEICLDRSVKLRSRDESLGSERFPTHLVRDKTAAGGQCRGRDWQPGLALSWEPELPADCKGGATGAIHAKSRRVAPRGNAGGVQQRNIGRPDR